MSYAELGFLIGLYFLPGVLVALPAGAASRRFGDKRLILSGLLLMTIGGAVCAMAESVGVLAIGRLVSGVGGVVLNVVMAKVVIDWFADRELVLAMAIFVNAFPIGVGLALLTLGTVSAFAGWQSAMTIVIVVTLAALLAVWAWCEVHQNDPQVAGAKTYVRTSLNGSEWRLVILGGSIWGVFNGCFALLFAFGPDLLVLQGGAMASTVGVIVGLATWSVVASVQVGGILGQNWIKPSVLMTWGALLWCFFLVVLALWPPMGPIAVVGACLAMGLPVGAIMSLPAESLRPDSRSLGTSYFYLWLYAGNGLLPPLAGWLRDSTGQPGAPILLSAILVLTMLGLYSVAQALISRRSSPG
jgi:predicted MFS family arabinose efflux permease